MNADPAGIRARRLGILRLAMPRASVVRVQGVLEGMDGLGVLRGGEDGRPELWTPAERVEEAAAWVAGLPSAWQVRLMDMRVTDSGEVE